MKIIRIGLFSGWNKSETCTNCWVDECVERERKRVNLIVHYGHTVHMVCVHQTITYLAWHGMAWVMLLCVCIFRMVRKESIFQINTPQTIFFAYGKEMFWTLLSWTAKNKCWNPLNVYLPISRDIEHIKGTYSVHFFDYPNMCTMFYCYYTAVRYRL